MIKPPFTLLILKDSHNPVTIRVTFGFLFTLFLIPLAFLLIGFITASYIGMQSLPPLSALFQGESSRMSDGSEIAAGPDMIHLDSDNNLTIAYTPAAADIERSYYFWVIINPGAENAERRIIYPRNPIDRGFPVDYRNGIRYRYDDGSGMSIRLRDEVDDIGLDELRILAYNDTGELVLDRIYSRDDNDDG